MSDGLANQLTREKIRQLLAAIGTRPAEEEQMDVSEHDWHQPHYFNSSQLSRLDNLTDKIAPEIAKTFNRLYHSDFNVVITSTTQFYANDFYDNVLNSGQNDYYLAFGSEQEHLFGLIKIIHQTAMTWTKQLLGDDEPEKDSSDSASQSNEGGASAGTSGLSHLEESLLSDIISAIVKSLSSVHPSWANYNFHPISELVRGQLPIKLSAVGEAEAGTLQSTQEICMIIFSVEKAGPSNDKSTSTGEACLLIPCNILAPIVGKITPISIGDKKLSSEEISKAMLEHLQQMPVSVKAQLASTMLSFEQIVSLGSCDILLLDKAIDEPIELIVEGRTAFRGKPARSAGQYAIVITEEAFIHNKR